MDKFIIVAILVLIGTILTIIGGFIGYFIKDFLDKKREINSENIKVKRDLYKKFVVIFFKTIHNSTKDNQGNLLPVDIKEDLHKFYEDYSLYSSPSVINAFGDFMQYAYKNAGSTKTKVTLSKVASVIKCMRKELGLSNKELGKNGERIFRAMFKDYDELE
jgi:hypothetical protein